MKKLLFVLLCCVFMTACDENRSPKCSENPTELMRTLTGWMQKAISDEYTVTVTNIDNFFELKTSPTLLGTTLYNDYKDARICEANAYILIKDKKGKEFKGETNVRYQYAVSIPNKNGSLYSGVRMSGADVKDLTEQLTNTIYKEFIR